MTEPTETPVDRIPVAHSIVYAVRGVPEIGDEYNAERTIAPTEICLTYRAAEDSHLGRVHAYVKGWWMQDGQRVPMDKPVGRHLYGTPEAWPAWLAAEARLHDPAVSAVPAPATDQGAPTAWIDGHPQLEAIAAAVWEQCRTEDTSLVVDDPRNIAVAAYAAVLSDQSAELARAQAEAYQYRTALQGAARRAARMTTPADRAAVLREAADRLESLDPVDAALAGQHAWKDAADLLRRVAAESAPADTGHAGETPQPFGADRDSNTNPKADSKAGTIVHAVPLPGSNGISTCCGRPPCEFVGERVTRDPGEVTCPGPEQPAAAQQPEAERCANCGL